MAIFPTSAHLVSWAKLSPRAIQSGAKTAPAKPARATATSRPCSARQLW
jgi:transposase